MRFIDLDGPIVNVTHIVAVCRDAAGQFQVCLDNGMDMVITEPQRDKIADLIRNNGSLARIGRGK